MKKMYVAPEMKLFAISADERVAADCGGGAHFTEDPFGCTETLVGGQPVGCQEGTVSGS